MPRTIYFTFLSFMIIGSTCARADHHAGNYCAQNVDRFSVPPVELSVMVRDIVHILGSSREFSLIECDLIRSAIILDPNSETASGNNVIIYNERWLHEVSAANPGEMIYVLAHEISHILNDHFDSDEVTRTKELEADVGAACAVAQLGHTWEDVERVIRALREDQATDLYESRAATLEHARRRFEFCSNEQNEIESAPELLRPDRSTVLVFNGSQTVMQDMARAANQLVLHVSEFEGQADVTLPDAATWLSVVPAESEITGAASVGLLRASWPLHQSAILLQIDQSSESVEELAGSTYSATIFFGSDTSDLPEALIGFGTSGHFIDVDNTELLNLQISRSIARLLVGYASLRISIEQQYPDPLIREYASFTHASLSDLRRYGENVEGFSSWARGLGAIDDLLRQVGARG